MGTIEKCAANPVKAPAAQAEFDAPHEFWALIVAAHGDVCYERPEGALSVCLFHFRAPR